MPTATIGPMMVQNIAPAMTAMPPVPATMSLRDLPPKNRTEHRVRESVQVREKGERNEQAKAVRG